MQNVTDFVYSAGLALMFERSILTASSDSADKANYRAAFHAPTIARVRKWHRDLVKVERWLPLTEAGRRLVLVLSAFGAFALYYSLSNAAYQTDTYFKMYLGLLLFGLLVFPFASFCALYLRERKAFLNRCLYTAGYRMRDNGHLVTNEPNPKILATSAQKLKICQKL